MNVIDFLSTLNPVGTGLSGILLGSILTHFFSLSRDRTKGISSRRRDYIAETLSLLEKTRECVTSLRSNIASRNPSEEAYQADMKLLESLAEKLRDDGERRRLNFQRATAKGLDAFCLDAMAVKHFHEQIPTAVEAKSRGSANLTQEYADSLRDSAQRLKSRLEMESTRIPAPVVLRYILMRIEQVFAARFVHPIRIRAFFRRVSTLDKEMLPYLFRVYVPVEASHDCVALVREQGGFTRTGNLSKSGRDILLEVLVPSVEVFTPAILVRLGGMPNVLTQAEAWRIESLLDVYCEAVFGRGISASNDLFSGWMIGGQTPASFF